MAIFQFVQDVGRPPLRICGERDWTTHEGHLMVFITVQNVVGIDVVVLIICMFFDFTSLAGEHPWAERRHMTYRSSKSVHWCDLCAWRRDQKRKTKTET